MHQQLKPRRSYADLDPAKQAYVADRDQRLGRSCPCAPGDAHLADSIFVVLEHRCLVLLLSAAGGPWLVVQSSSDRRHPSAA